MLKQVQHDVVKIPGLWVRINLLSSPPYLPQVGGFKRGPKPSRGKYCGDYGLNDC